MSLAWLGAPEHPCKGRMHSLSVDQVQMYCEEITPTTEDLAVLGPEESRAKDRPEVYRIFARYARRTA